MGSAADEAILVERCARIRCPAARDTTALSCGDFPREASAYFH
jgi:hypothetical protein